MQGGAGKSADVAVAGGKDPSKLDEALALARSAAGLAWRVLALDLGSKRIGVAVSDPTESIATPDRVIERTGSKARDHKAIAAAGAEWDAELVVVGLPLSLSGADGPAARAAREEAAELERRAARPSGRPRRASHHSDCFADPHTGKDDC